MVFTALGLLLSVTVHAVESVRTEKPSPGAWNQAVYKWRYNPANKPMWLTGEQSLALVLLSAKAWESCGVKMDFLGLTKSAPGKMDRQNVVGWSLKMPKKLRGLTMGQAKSGALLERDVLIRPDRAEFKQSFRLLRKVITHEFGHAIGLTHSTQCGDVMTLAASCPKADPKALPIKLTANDLKRCHKIYHSFQQNR